MNWIGIAGICMVVAYMAHNLGLVDKVYAICADIIKCPMCFCFWVGLVVLLLESCPLLLAIPLSLFFAYLSNWFGLLWDGLSKLHHELWLKRMNKQNHQREKQGRNRLS